MSRNFLVVPDGLCSTQQPAGVVEGSGENCGILSRQFLLLSLLITSRRWLHQISWKILTVFTLLPNNAARLWSPAATSGWSGPSAASKILIARRKRGSLCSYLPWSMMGKHTRSVITSGKDHCGGTYAQQQLLAISNAQDLSPVHSRARRICAVEYFGPNGSAGVEATSVITLRFSPVLSTPAKSTGNH